MRRERFPLGARTHRAWAGLLATVLLLLLLLYPGDSSGASSLIEKWEPPAGRPLQLIRGYEPPPTPYAAGHRGVDLAAVSGRALLAPADGVVSFAGPVAGRGVISIRVDRRTVLSLEPVETPLAEGDLVQRGQTIGTILDGHCTAACVHLGVRVDGEYVNPMRYLSGVPELLPW